ncbi:ImmA/IrrE family metallo-endopeptidase [Bifidobacterium sp. ESL0728]|uniref:ImmA/IrrE family metallo-endopeptidase n=1 Tax=Bifidobacterium sp. ESL0728 TaxID=2983220 RepID=UPI0023F9CA4C|nr:ImmA/IrrE family metallo-endopeptidase [Bifidobacterium sp. ESL0728]WEV59714.1 ImmA/IrrE family metallo-endopeptidase [Bifidobacterium sp. ESL0728]
MMQCYDEMLSTAQALGFEVIEESIPSDCDGLYLWPYRLIVIDQNLPEYVRRCTLCHELVHAEHDDRGCGSRTGMAAEARTRRETALHLIDVPKYKLAEEMYDGDSSKIASELNVTRQVVEDFRSWLQNQEPRRIVMKAC